MDNIVSELWERRANADVLRRAEAEQVISRIKAIAAVQNTKACETDNIFAGTSAFGTTIALLLPKTRRTNGPCRSKRKPRPSTQLSFGSGDDDQVLLKTRAFEDAMRKTTGVTMWPRQVRRSFMRDVKGLFEKCYGDAVSRKKQDTVLWKKALSAWLPW